jgi:hypothetical protein
VRRAVATLVLMRYLNDTAAIGTALSDAANRAELNLAGSLKAALDTRDRFRVPSIGSGSILVSNILTDWREQLVAHLDRSSRWPRSNPGVRPPAPSRDKDLIAVFWPGMGEAGNVNFANPTMTVRYWVKDPKLLPKA